MEIGPGIAGKDGKVIPISVKKVRSALYQFC